MGFSACLGYVENITSSSTGVIRLIKGYGVCYRLYQVNREEEIISRPEIWDNFNQIREREFRYEAQVDRGNFPIPPRFNFQ